MPDAGTGGGYADRSNSSSSSGEDDAAFPGAILRGSESSKSEGRIMRRFLLTKPLFLFFLFFLLFFLDVCVGVCLYVCVSSLSVGLGVEWIVTMLVIFIFNAKVFFVVFSILVTTSIAAHTWMINGTRLSAVKALNACIIFALGCGSLLSTSEVVQFD